MGRVELVERGVRHEEERVAELLHARLEAVRRGDGVVVAGDPAVLPEHPFAHLAAEHEAGLDHRREDEDALRLLPEDLRARLPCVELAQLRGGVAGELGRAGGAGGARDRRGEGYRGDGASQGQRSGRSHHGITSPLLRTEAAR